MESVLAGFVLVFLLIFGMLNFSHATFSAQVELSAGWQAMYSREKLNDSTRLQISQIFLTDHGQSLVMIVENKGESRLIDFEDWDVIVQYDDDSPMPIRHMSYAHYTDAVPNQNEWTVEGFFLNDAAATLTPETFEHDIFNPGEEARLQVALEKTVGEGQALQVVIGLPTGNRLSTMLIRNIRPVLVTNAGLAMTSGTTAVIDASLLHTVDQDHQPQDLTYVIVTGPTQGTLSLPHNFTQADIDAGLLNYTHTGSASDSFQFSVTDGMDLIGTYTFVIAAA